MKYRATHDIYKPWGGTKKGLYLQIKKGEVVELVAWRNEVAIIEKENGERMAVEKKNIEAIKS